MNSNITKQFMRYETLTEALGAVEEIQDLCAKLQDKINNARYRGLDIEVVLKEEAPYISVTAAGHLRVVREGY